ncbi:MAG TPA: YciI family protein [Candidatus Methylomirabilis sp.]
MTQYLMSVYYEEGVEQPAPDVMEQMFADVNALNDKMTDAGIWVFGGGLETPDNSKVVNGASGNVVVTDGPFPEAKEQIGGFWVIEAKDLDAALEWARQATVACRGPVEVRPFQDEPA